ncbi:hypothetical protein AURDEDRAFT_164062 [Auricularia subglabra TFB-10046 SS5]|nr:hypothetical protein AURDEDRAFT_164062 [Auricularia subglabra TFB-10046 SS5]
MYNAHHGFQSVPPAQPVTAASARPESSWKQALCCTSVQCHRPILTHWEAQFEAFLVWLEHHGKRESGHPPRQDPNAEYEFIIRVTTTINYGRVCGWMDYAAVRGTDGGFFHSVPLSFAGSRGFSTRAAFKNYTCQAHNLYFQVDIYIRATAVPTVR